MRVGLYSPYLDSFGGGERYLATAAEFFGNDGDVTIFWDNPKILAQLETRFSLNFKNVKISLNIFKKGLLGRWKTLKNFDLLFILSDGAVPVPFAVKNILHFQEPLILQGRTLKNRLKLKKYVVICNSQFTKKYIDESFGIDSQVIYPPVDTDFFTPGNKEKIILSVGRFLEGGQGKKQEILIEAFDSAQRRSLSASQRSSQSSVLKGWQLWLAGGVGDKEHFATLKKKAANLSIKFFPDNNALQLKKLYSQATIYWHAKGFSEDLDKNPQFAEHFGISVVEAQSAGCIPLAFDAGGVQEIISDGENGFLWEIKEELIEKTKNLISNPNLVTKMQKEAIITSHRFSKEKFFKNLEKIV